MISRQALYNTLLAMAFASQATMLAVLIFMFSRGDHDMKLLALGAAISQTSALMSTASTMLVGRDFAAKTTHDPNDLPPGSAVTTGTTETVQTPPVTLAPVPDAANTQKENPVD